MAAGSDIGRRLLAIGAVCCAVCGLLLAASAMPMLASESPANDFLDGGGGEQESMEPANVPAQEAHSAGDTESEQRTETGDDGTSESSAAADESATGDGVPEESTDALATGESDSPAAALADRADEIDNSIVERALYGLAGLVSLFDDGAGASPDHSGSADAAPDDPASDDADIPADSDVAADAETETDAEGSLAEAGVDGEFGDLLDSSVDSGEFAEDSSGEGDDPEADDEFDGQPESADDADGEGSDGSDTDDGSWDGDTDDSDSDGWSDHEDGAADGEQDGSSESDGDERTGSGDDWDGSDGESDSDGENEWDGSDDGADTDDEQGADDGGYEGGDEVDEDASERDQEHETEGESADGETRDDEPGSETDGDDDGSDTGDADDTDDDGDEGGTTAEDGGDESALEDAVPGLSAGDITTALVALALLILGYLCYTRRWLLGAVLSIPGRLVSLALTAVVACSQALERAIRALRGLRSIADLPGLVLAAIAGAFRSAGTRVRTVRSSLFGDETTGEGDEGDETHVPARQRIRRAFESVIDASPMYRGRVATATPSDVARSARNAGAPDGPVETITDSFRDVEYGDRDPESYLERTTTAHDRLRSTLESTETEEAAEADGTDGTSGTDSTNSNPEADPGE
ncbi:hypothetical protein GS429_04670 [Natronorubrum sp. JWXQ-INN-674]|uniref:DUF4129 domain-containing protein n=1 Tax=Natronorubrum halalkaliphilum TaxID=2691917 RepID=A0A6B0VIH5_9EURY|nr:hypothetical protein [Natronorubrum halalkaliphilum]MXV61368.1 hypothetical protein [Natronorubrum halalkaliphilum]